MDILSKLNSIFDTLTTADCVAVDYGTAMLRLGILGKGIVLREPSYIALNSKNGSYLYYGQDAYDIFGKTPPYLQIIKPMLHSVVSDFDAASALLTELGKLAVFPYYSNQKFIRRSLAAYSIVPTSATEVQQLALTDVLIKSGFRSSFLIPKPIAVASGAGFDVFSRDPSFVIDMGAGLFEIAIIIMGGVVQSKVIKEAGIHMDKQVQNYLKFKSGIVVGDQTAEDVKIKLLSFDDTKDSLVVRGKSIENNLPKECKVTRKEIMEALSSHINRLIEGIKEIIEIAPPEVIDGIIKSGMTLTGAMANIPGLATYISEATEFKVNVAPRPEDASIIGLMKLLDQKDMLQKIVI